MVLVAIQAALLLPMQTSASLFPGCCLPLGSQRGYSLDFLDVPLPTNIRSTCRAEMSKQPPTNQPQLAVEEKKRQKPISSKPRLQPSRCIANPARTELAKPRVCDILVPDHGTSGRLSCMVLWQVWAGTQGRWATFLHSCQTRDVLDLYLYFGRLVLRVCRGSCRKGLGWDDRMLEAG
jgi:hypothetical protein